MVRKSAMILAGFLTAVVLALSAMAFNVVTGEWVVFGAQPSMASALPADETTAFYTDVAAQADEIYRQREAMLQAQVSALQSNVAEQDITYQAEVVRLQEALTEVEQTIEETTNDIGALNGLTAIARSRMQQDETEFQQHLAQLQGRDGQLQQQLDGALVQLQAAYDQIAALQPAGQGSNGGSSNDSQSNNSEQHSYDDDDDEHEHEDDEHEDDEHEGGEHDDDDDEHDDDD